MKMNNIHRIFRALDVFGPRWSMEIVVQGKIKYFLSIYCVFWKKQLFPKFNLFVMKQVFLAGMSKQLCRLRWSSVASSGMFHSLHPPHTGSIIKPRYTHQLLSKRYFINVTMFALAMEISGSMENNYEIGEPWSKTAWNTLLQVSFENLDLAVFFVFHINICNILARQTNVSFRI